MPYSTNLTDAEWETLAPLLNQILPKKKKTRPPNWTQREILNGIFASTQKWLQLGFLTLIPATLLNSILALQAFE